MTRKWKSTFRLFTTPTRRYRMEVEINVPSPFTSTVTHARFHWPTSGTRTPGRDHPKKVRILHRRQRSPTDREEPTDRGIRQELCQLLCLCRPAARKAHDGETSTGRVRPADGAPVPHRLRPVSGLERCFMGYWRTRTNGQGAAFFR